MVAKSGIRTRQYDGVVGLRTVTFDPLGGILLGAVALTFIVSARHLIAVRDYGRLAARYQELAAIDGVIGLYDRRHSWRRPRASSSLPADRQALRRADD